MRYQDKIIPLEEKVKNIYAIGDMHGEFMPVVFDLLNSCKLKNAAVIVCGDIGMGFNSKNWYISMFQKMENDLASKNVYLIMFRGNHDDPSYFKYIEDDTLTKEFPHCILAEDFSIVAAPVKYNNYWNCLLWGGAISIDRTQRISGQSYWLDETILSLPDNFKKTNLDPRTAIHCVCTHSAPSFCFPKTKGFVEDFAKYDKTLIQDCEKERELLAQGAYELKSANPMSLKLWCYGHFHETYWNYKEASDELKRLNIQFIGLDMYRNSFYAKKYASDHYDIFNRSHSVNLVKLYSI